MSVIVETKVIKEKITPAKKIEVYVFCCDVPECDQRAVRLNNRARECKMCARHLCEDHTAYDYYYSDDYPDKVCVICFSYLTPARKELFDRHDREEELMLRNVKKVSLMVTKDIVKFKI